MSDSEITVDPNSPLKSDTESISEQLQSTTIDTEGTHVSTQVDEEIAQEQQDQEEDVEVEKIEEVQEEEDDDDDFGSFSDASFDDFEEPQSPQLQAQSEQLVVPSSEVITDDNDNRISFPQSTFDDPEKLQSKLNELIDLAFPEISTTSTTTAINPTTFNDQETEDVEEVSSSQPFIPNTLLNQRSQHLLDRLTSQIYLKPYNWQTSSLRKQLLVTLGITDPTLLKGTRSYSYGQRLNGFNADDYVVKQVAELGIKEDEKLKLKNDTDFILEEYLTHLESDEVLLGLDEDTLEKITERYEKELELVDKLLSIWEAEKVHLKEDNDTFEGVVENLIGHTQRLRREETFKSLKKEKEKNKGIGSIFRKKKK